MKSRLTLAVITLLLTIGLSSAAAYADTITLTLNNPTQMTATIGATLLFNATISAPSTNKANVFLNGDDFTVSSPLTLDDTDFFLNFPALLNPGQSVTDALFTITIPAGPVGLFPGSFTLLGGSDGGAQNVLASENFQVVATPRTFHLPSDRHRPFQSCCCCQTQKKPLDQLAKRIGCAVLLEEALYE